MEHTSIPELTAFTSVMESRLKENAGREDWRTHNFYYLAACLVSNLEKSGSPQVLQSITAP